MYHSSSRTALPAIALARSCAADGASIEITCDVSVCMCSTCAIGRVMLLYHPIVHPVADIDWYADIDWVGVVGVSPKTFLLLLLQKWHMPSRPPALYGVCGLRPQGPPGTGKTRTLLALIAVLVGSSAAQAGSWAAMGPLLAAGGTNAAGGWRGVAWVAWLVAAGVGVSR
jgi:hypothetical protein